MRSGNTLRNRVDAGANTHPGGPLLLPQNEIDDPAAPDVRPRPPKVAQDVRVRAAGLFEGVGQDGHTVEGPLVVDGLGNFGHGAAAPNKPRGVDAGWPEGIAYGVAK